MAAPTYDQHCLVQNAIADQAITLLCHHQRDFGRVADFACGTGESTRQLLTKINYRSCYAIDFCENLLLKAKSKSLSKVDFILSDFEHAIFEKESLDLIFCNMGLQWSLQLEEVVNLFSSYLRESGWFAFSLPLKHNFPELKSKLPLFTHENIFEILSKAYFQLADFAILEHKIYFSSCYEALKSLQYTGANYSLSGMKNRRVYSRRLLEDLFLQTGKEISLTYRVGIYIANCFKNNA